MHLSTQDKQEISPTDSDWKDSDALETVSVSKESRNCRRISEIKKDRMDKALRILASHGEYMEEESLKLNLKDVSRDDSENREEEA